VSKADLHVLNGRTAGFVTRLFAYVLDVAVVAGIVAIGGWIAVLVDNTIEQVGFDPRVDMATIYVGMIPLIITLYFVMFWSLTGRTIGKWFMGLRVVTADGRSPTIGRSIVRILGYVVSTVVFWGGFLWVLVDRNRRGWHDHFAKTWVVYDYSRGSDVDPFEAYATSDDG